MEYLKKPIIIYPILFAIGLVVGMQFTGDSPNGESSTPDEPITYTCSMHPQVQQQEEGDCPICGMDLIPASQLSAGSSLGVSLGSDQLQLADVRTMRVGMPSSSSTERKRFTGRLEANEEEDLVQSTHFEGRVEQSSIRYEGQRVVRGQIVAQIYSPDWLQLQEEIILASKQQQSTSLLEALLTKARNRKVAGEDIRRLLSEQRVQETVPLRAEKTGFIRKIYAQEGDYLKEGSPFYVSNSFESLWAVLDAREEDAQQIRYGSEVSIEMVGLEEAIESTIDFIPTEIDPQSRRLRLRATIPNTSQNLQAGSSIQASVQLQPTSSQAKLSVPSTAVLWTGKRSLVYLKQGEVFIPTDVQLANNKGEQWHIQSGLQAGDEIAISGVFNLDAAAQLQGLSSMMNRSANPYNELSLTNEQLGGMLNLYIDIKNALVKEDFNVSRASSIQLKQLSNTLSDSWKETGFYRAAQKMGAIESGLIESRVEFEPLSLELYHLLKAHPAKNTPYFYQYCPMAFNDKGAYWISEEEPIQNPYFGNRMLRCGETRERLAPAINQKN